MTFRRFASFSTLITTLGITSLASAEKIAAASTTPSAAAEQQPSTPLSQQEYQQAMPPLAKGPAHHHDMNKMERNRRMELEASLNLTADQKQKMQTLREKYRPQAQANHNKLVAAMKEFEIVFVSNKSKGDVDDAWDKVDNIREDMREDRAKWMLEAREILTPEQRRRFVRHVAASERMEDFLMGGAALPPPQGGTGAPSAPAASP